MHKITRDNWCAVESYKFTFLAFLINSAHTFFKSDCSQFTQAWMFGMKSIHTTVTPVTTVNNETKF